MSIGIECTCPSCGEKLTVIIDKKKAKELYKAHKGRRDN